MGSSALFLYLVTGPTDGRKMGQKPGSVQEKFEVQTQLTLSLSFADPVAPSSFLFLFLSPLPSNQKAITFKSQFPLPYHELEQ